MKPDDLIARLLYLFIAHQINRITCTPLKIYIIPVGFQISIQ